MDLSSTECYFAYTIELIDSVPDEYMISYIIIAHQYIFCFQNISVQRQTPPFFAAVPCTFVPDRLARFIPVFSASFTGDSL